MARTEYNVCCFAPQPLSTEPPEYHTTRPHRPAPPACARVRARASEQQRLFLVGVMWCSVTPHCATFTPQFAALHPQDDMSYLLLLLVVVVVDMSPGIHLYSHVFTPGPQILYNTVFSWLPLCIPHLGCDNRQSTRTWVAVDLIWTIDLLDPDAGSTSVAPRDVARFCLSRKLNL